MASSWKIKVPLLVLALVVGILTMDKCLEAQDHHCQWLPFMSRMQNPFIIFFLNYKVSLVMGVQQNPLSWVCSVLLRFFLTLFTICSRSGRWWWDRAGEESWGRTPPWQLFGFYGKKGILHALRIRHLLQMLCRSRLNLMLPFGSFREFLYSILRSWQEITFTLAWRALFSPTPFLMVC